MTLTEAFTLAQTLVLTGGVLFAALQFRQLASSRREQEALQAARSMQTPEWIRSAILVNNLPAGLSAEAVDRLPPDVLAAAVTVAMMLETTGYLAYRRVIPVPMVAELYGGIVLLAWDRLQPWVERDREGSGNAKSFEWFQWLAERLREHRSLSRPAYVAHRHAG